MLGAKPGDLVESTILTSLADPNEIGDTSWIKPGKVAWDWWNGPVVPNVPWKAGMNDETFRHFIDFAAEFGLEYVLIDAGWYGDHRDGGADITRPIPEMDIPGLAAYAKGKNVGLLVWLNWEAVREQMDVAFPLYEKWGLAGVKIDYMDRKDQEIVAFYQRATRTAAKYHLTVDFHGAYAGSGEERTFPNWLTREGVMGLEYCKWSDRVTPRHNVTIPFTRMLTGPMDYTPGGFRNVTAAEFAPRNELPVVMTTRAQQLAMYVVYDSPLQMLSDTPSAYRGEPGAEFLKAVPATWDETRVLDGKIGEYVVIARRHGSRVVRGGDDGRRPEGRDPARLPRRQGLRRHDLRGHARHRDEPDPAVRAPGQARGQGLAAARAEPRGGRRGRAAPAARRRSGPAVDRGDGYWAVNGSRTIWPEQAPGRLRPSTHRAVAAVSVSFTRAVISPRRTTLGPATIQGTVMFSGMSCPWLRSFPPWSAVRITVVCAGSAVSSRPIGRVDLGDLRHVGRRHPALGVARVVDVREVHEEEVEPDARLDDRLVGDVRRPRAP